MKHFLWQQFSRCVYKRTSQHICTVFSRNAVFTLRVTACWPFPRLWAWLYLCHSPAMCIFYKWLVAGPSWVWLHEKGLPKDLLDEPRFDIFSFPGWLPLCAPGGRPRKFFSYFSRILISAQFVRGYQVLFVNVRMQIYIFFLDKACLLQRHVLCSSFPHLVVHESLLCTSQRRPEDSYSIWGYWEYSVSENNLLQDSSVTMMMRNDIPIISKGIST